VAIFWPSPRVPGYRVGENGGTPNQDAWIENRLDDRLPIVFENGSRFDLLTGSRAKVVTRSEEEVMLDLGRGRLLAEIEGNGVTEWVVAAGPYRVKVLGTRFLVAWDQGAGRLDVEVSAGRVVVEEVDRARKRIALAAGEKLSADRGSGKIVIAPRTASFKPEAGSKQAGEARKTAERPETSPRRGAPETGALGRGTSLDGVRETPLADERHPVETTAPGEGSSWKRLVRREDWRGAVDHAGAREIREMADEATQEALWHLANTLRHQRRGAEAVRLFKALRRRFPEASRAGTALFLIGKIHLTLFRNQAGARQWFVQYLQEVEAGDLREEALGHLMEICSSLGDRRCAKEHAERYLKQYRGGVFHTRAQSIMAD
jgi:hypothetical protein